MDKKYLLLYALCFLGGCYLRHWIHTGTGQFQRMTDIIGKDW